MPIILFNTHFLILQVELHYMSFQCSVKSNHTKYNTSRDKYDSYTDGGLGHTTSLVNLCRIFGSFRTSTVSVLETGHFGTTVSGKSFGDGFHDSSFNNVIFSTPALEFLTYTAREYLKCWNLDMPL